MKKIKLSEILCLILGLSVIMLPGVCDVVKAENLDEIVAIADQIKNEKPGIEVDFWRKGKNTEYKPGDEVVLGFKCKQDCYVAIIDLGSSGKATVLFPNKWNKDNKAKKDVEYRIPAKDSKYLLKVKGPEGVERVKLLASVDPILKNVESLQKELKKPVASDSEDGNAFLTMKEPKMVLKDIAAEVKKIDPSKWATLELKFDIAKAEKVEEGTEGQEEDKAE